METYIKMCDCPEVQGQWRPKVGDRYKYVDEIATIWKYREGMFFYSTETRAGANDDLREGNIWLPRQSDIQEMLLKATGIPWEWFLLVEAMVMWVGNNQEPIYTNMKINELWLCYYMREVHNKHWTDEGWR